MSNLVDAVTGVLTGQNKIQTASDVKVTTDASTFNAIVLVGAIILGAAWILRPHRAPPKRRSKRRRRR